jgi:oxazoline/thiazoline synthase
MLEHPRIKQCYTVGVLEPSLLFLMTEHTELTFQGEAYVALAPLLDGRRSLGEVLSQASARAGLPSLFAALDYLEQKGCLAEGEGLDDDRGSAFWDYLGAAPARVREALAAGVEVRAGAHGDVFRSALEAAGLRAAEGGALRLMVVDDYLDPALAEWNREALRSERPWALAKPTGTIVWAGPVFVPGRTACWECLAHRLAVNRQVEHYLARRTAAASPLPVPRAALPSSVRLAAQWSATEIARALVLDGGGERPAAIFTLDLVGRSLAEHALARRPQCPACGVPARGATGGPVGLVTRPRPEAPHGGERTSSAAETYERFKHLVSPLTGVVTSLVPRETAASGAAHNYVAGHYFPMTSDDLSVLRINLLARSGGKGRTEAQAKTAALCEAVERYSGIAWGEEPRVTASYAALAEEAVHVRELAGFSQRQYAARGEAPAASELHEVPAPLPDDREIAWTPSWSLSRGRRVYLPMAYCYYGHRDPGLFFTRCDSNGSAAGNSLEEAILYGFLELVERDSVALWWYNRLPRPGVDAASFGLPYWSEMTRYYEEQLGRDLHALDLTADLGIPTFAVVSRRRGHEVEDVIVGFAAHLDPAVALLRALEEANQYLPSVRERDEDGNTVYRLYSEETVRWWRSATFANQPYLVPDAAAAPRRREDFARAAGRDVKQDVETCVAAAARSGLEVLVVDQTRPDIGMPVAKVVVPGLRHFWRRLGPGRLFDVPVKMGWLAAPKKEEEMNPISCFV